MQLPHFNVQLLKYFPTLTLLTISEQSLAPILTEAAQVVGPAEVCFQ